jgi:hypothetical protein
VTGSSSGLFHNSAEKTRKKNYLKKSELLTPYLKWENVDKGVLTWNLSSLGQLDRGISGTGK